jgi:Transposase DDE domain.
VATFCLHTGMVVASAVGSTVVPEQTLACQQILKDIVGHLYLGDRNFGVFQMVQCVLTANAHCLFRMSKPRAKKVAGSSSRLHRPGDYLVSWSPSRHDLRHDGCWQYAINGRLIVTQYVRPGFRSQWIYLFTTLLDASVYPAKELLELYGARWQVELNLRYLKTQMDLHQLDCKTKDMAEKEWLSGLMAYNLVRVVMATAAMDKGIQPSHLSFSTARRLLVRWLLNTSSWTNIYSLWRKLLKDVARAKLPSRRNPRPPEPRAKRHKRETFPPLRGSRSVARKNIRINSRKS